VRHVLIETNWVVDYAAPVHRKVPQAVELLRRASDGEIRLYLPAICISEAHRPLEEKSQVRAIADEVRKFLRWARQEGTVNGLDEEATRRVLDKMESKVKADLDSLDGIFKSLTDKRGLEIFNLSEEMLETCTTLSFLELGLDPFDQAILAAILVKARQISGTESADVAFCERDSDLQPWGKRGPRKEALAKLYDDAGVWVYEDFLLLSPEKPMGWPQKR
jgi:predicted nucleic acid-binding protein